MIDAKAISKRLYAIKSQLVEKTGKRVSIDPYLRIADDECSVVMYFAKGNDSYYSPPNPHGETPEAALTAAEAFVAAMKSHDEAKLHDHMARVADCIDKAHADGIADEFVDPLRMTVKAISDNLLAAPVKQ